MEKVEMQDEIVEVKNMSVSANTDGLIDTEIKAGCQMLKFTCPCCGGWIANAVVQKSDRGYYRIIRSGCSSNYEGVDQPCRNCRESEGNRYAKRN